MVLPPTSFPRINRPAWIQILSALVPGFLLLVELAVLIKPKLFQSLLQQQFSGLVTILGLILVVVVSYTIGLVTRHIGFTVAKRISTWRRPDAWYRSPVNAFKHAAVDFTAEGIAEALRGLPITVDGNDATPDTLMKGYFSYTKLWLRRYAPDSGVDRHELEINVLFSLALPIAVAGGAGGRAILTAIQNPAWWAVVAIIGAMILLTLSCSFFILTRGIQIRKWENVDSLRDYVALWHVLNNPPPTEATTYVLPAQISEK